MTERKVWLITGAGRGLGVDIARAALAAGHAVVATARNTGAVTAALGQDDDLLAVKLDVTDRADAEAAARAAAGRFGRIDVLVNNVGGSAAGGPVEMPEEVWDAQVDSNLKSVFLTCKHVLPIMEQQKSGAVVNIASASGLRFTGAVQVGYAATKAGVIQLTRVVAVQYAPKGIRLNTVIPGQLHTPMVEARLAKQRTGGDVEALLRQRQARIPQGFMGDGRDTANAVLFLASDEARFITGAEIVVDGGMTGHVSHKRIADAIGSAAGTAATAADCGEGR
jgi:NAD(P)-dependent dehydrogenase (short-subunit alcohol dehydrogenase family)